MAALHGIGTVVGLDGSRVRVSDGAPRCRLVTEAVLVADPDARRDLLLDGSWRRSRGLIEAPLTKVPGPGSVRCEGNRATVEADGATLLVVRERIHPGWRFRSDTPLQPIPVDEVHTGVLLPPGRHEVTWSFVPPGMVAALVVAGLAWLVGLFGLRSDRRRPSW